MKKTLKILDYMLMATLSLLAIIFILYPFLKVFIYSFYGDAGFNLDGFLFLKDEYNLILNSIFVSVFVSITTIIISLSIGIYSYFSRDFVRKIISLILMITIISPPFVSSLAYIKLFGRRGFITNGIFGLSFDAYGSFGVILMQSIGFISLSTLMIISFLENVDKTQINSAKSLGAKTSNIILDVIIPQLKPAIKVVLILTFIRSIADFSIPLIIGGSFETLASKAYLTFITDGNLQRAGAMNVIICIPVILMFSFYIRNSKLMENTSHGSGSFENTLNKGGFVFNLVRIFTFVFVLFLILQYASIILSAFTDYAKGKMYFTLEHFNEIGEYIGNTVYRSIIYSIIASFFGSLFGLLLQYYICIRDKKFLKYIDFIATMPYMLPGTFFGIGYILAFNDYPIYITGTALIVVLNITFKQLPFSTKMFNASLSAIDKNQILSARDLGANELFVFKDVVIPNSRNGFMVSMINGFNSTMTTIGSIIFLVYPTQKLLTLVMFDVINSGKYNIASVIALIIILICILFSILLFALEYVFRKIGDGYVFRIK